jgi:hypothetical protein
MYYKLDNNEYETIRDISNITIGEYDLIGEFIPVESLMAAIVDLFVEYHNLQEEFEDYKQDVEDNYKPLTIAEQVGGFNE